MAARSRIVEPENRIKFLKSTFSLQCIYIQLYTIKSSVIYKDVKSHNILLPFFYSCEQQVVHESTVELKSIVGHCIRVSFKNGSKSILQCDILELYV